MSLLTSALLANVSSNICNSYENTQTQLSFPKPHTSTPPWSSDPSKQTSPWQRPTVRTTELEKRKKGKKQKEEKTKIQTLTNTKPTHHHHQISQFGKPAIPYPHPPSRPHGTLAPSPEKSYYTFAGWWILVTVLYYFISLLRVNAIFFYCIVLYCTYCTECEDVGVK